MEGGGGRVFGEAASEREILREFPRLISPALCTLEAGGRR